MNPQVYKMLLTLGIFISLPSLCILFITPPDNPSFIISAMTICVGVVMIGLSAYLIHRSRTK